MCDNNNYQETHGQKTLRMMDVGRIGLLSVMQNIKTEILVEALPLQLL
jgi:hypothetical protein